MCVHADDMSVVVPYRDLNPDPYHGKPQNLTNLTMYSFFDIDRLLDAIVKIGMVRAWPPLAAVSGLTHMCGGRGCTPAADY